MTLIIGRYAWRRDQVGRRGRRRIAKRSFALFQWTTLLPDVAVKPDTHNLFLIRDTDELYSHLRVTIIPDGGIVRYHAYQASYHDHSINSFSIFFHSRLVFAALAALFLKLQNPALKPLTWHLLVMEVTSLLAAMPVTASVQIF